MVDTSSLPRFLVELVEPHRIDPAHSTHTHRVIDSSTASTLLTSTQKVVERLAAEANHDHEAATDIAEWLGQEVRIPPPAAGTLIGATMSRTEAFALWVRLMDSTGAGHLDNGRIRALDQAGHPDMAEQTGFRFRSRLRRLNAPLFVTEHTAANRIKDARAALGMTQQELADALGVIRVTVARWESGTRTPDGPVWMALRALAHEQRDRRQSELDQPSPSSSSPANT